MRHICGVTGALDYRYAAVGDFFVHIHGVREPHDVVLARDDVGRRGNIAEHICGEVWQGEHHIIKLVVAEHIVDFYTYDEIRLHRLRTRVGAAGYYRARNIGVSCGECQRDNSAVAVTYNCLLYTSPSPRDRG